MKKKVLIGNCFICGKTFTKTTMKNHIYKEHNSGDEKCYLIKAEGYYNKSYWLYSSISIHANLTEVDDFLRDIWCECCQHLSAFTINNQEISKKTKIVMFSLGEKVEYHYDFGSTTKIILTVIDEIFRLRQREKICLIGRNVPEEFLCNHCGKPAVYCDCFGDAFFCEECKIKCNDEVYLLPITNSPRCGVCGYSGDYDKWDFKQKSFNSKEL
ncbi:MAG: hypothetical protein PHX04_00605 [Bacilli bacterium]|nr:hypothetical protein [Bacilli bacterium]